MNASLQSALEKRILLLDGATGTMIQRADPQEADFRGEIFRNHPIPLLGNNDLLCLTRPDLVTHIHEQYLEAGADIITTNSFNANSLSQEEFKTTEYVSAINLAAARLARQAADAAATQGKPRFVCGCIGPTSKAASMPAGADDPAARAVTFDELVAAYSLQVQGLLDGGVDVLMLETAFDALNVKAGIEAITHTCNKRDVTVPVMISASVSGPGERLLTGQSVEAFCTAVSHAPNLLTIGLNCGLGAAQLAPVLRRLHTVAPCRISFHPNAGLPDTFGNYSQTPEKMCEEVLPILHEGRVAIIGGCCGTGPEHIRALNEALTATRFSPQPIPPQKNNVVFSNIENFTLPDNLRRLIRVGERTNVAGSRRFLRLIREENFAEAVAVGREQVIAGADIVDVNMDDPMLNAPAAMKRFLNAAAVEPELCNAPVMIDSSDWKVVLTGLKCLQGRGIVNSISLKEGEAAFLSHASDIRRFGASALVMCFDEKGQADTLERRKEIAARSYNLLVKNAFSPEHIIVDPNVFAIATGLPEHNRSAVDFIEAVRWIKANLPHALTSGGISNVSFAFRGNNTIREWIHALFLHHAFEAGLDMAIVNPTAIVPLSEIPKSAYTIIESAILNRTPDASTHLSELAIAQANEQHPPSASKKTTAPTALLTPDERLENAIISGNGAEIEQTVNDALALRATSLTNEADAALAILEGPLMNGLAVIGERFSTGRVFLPQVLKSAQVMKQASALLEPRIQHSLRTKSGTPVQRPHMLLATVKGDVHDIGKNIVATVMRCNGWDITDLGVMVDGSKIIETAKQKSVDLIGLSGLITPSLAEMENVAERMENEGFRIPLVVGGAAVSELHTAIKIAPKYSGTVACGGDASGMPTLCASLVRKNLSRVTAVRIADEQEKLRKTYQQSRLPQRTVAEARKAARTHRAVRQAAPAPLSPGVHRFRNIPLNELTPLISWPMFLAAFGFRTREQRQTEAAKKLLADAQTFLDSLPLPGGETLRVHGVSGLFPGGAENETIFTTFNGKTVPIQTARQLGEKADGHCIADNVLPGTTSPLPDWIGMQAVCAGNGLDEIRAALRTTHDDYHALIAELLATRLAEAGAEWIHRKTVKEYWGGKNLGIRPAPGYPACPDHALKRIIFDALDAEAATGARLTESHMMVPEASTCAFIIR